MSGQTRKELEVFRQFAETSTLGIDLDTISKRDPPEPDILCRTRSGESLAVELVEVRDEHLAKVTSDKLTLEKAFSNLVEGRQQVPPGVQDAFIRVCFDKDASLRRRKQTLPKLLNALRDLPPHFCGEVGDATKRIANCVKTVAIHRYGNVGGPHLEVAAVTSFGDTTIETVLAKIKKRYEPEGRLCLLVYTAFQPMHAGTEWAPNMPDILRSVLRESVFTTAWLFDTTTLRIMDIGPNAS